MINPILEAVYKELTIPEFFIESMMKTRFFWRYHQEIQLA